MERTIEVKWTRLPIQYRRPAVGESPALASKEIGRRGMALAIGYFGSNGYTVCIPMNDTQWYDLIVEKDGKTYTVQVKATSTPSGLIYLFTKGGSKSDRHICDAVAWHDLDYLFCVDRYANCYLIPGKELKDRNIVRKINLRTHPPKRGPKGFGTYNYIVEMTPWKEIE